MIGGASSDDGYYRINRIPAGTYTLIIRMMGYRTLIVHNLKVSPGGNRVVNIGLKKKVIPMREVRITGGGQGNLLQNEISLVGHEVISPREIVKGAGTLEDAYRALSNLPGVTSRNDFNTQLYVRGGSPDQNLILYNGVEILSPSRLFVVMGGGISLVNPDIVSTIDLAPGGFGVEYGNKMSALVQIRTRDGNKKKTSVRSSAALVTARAVAEGPINDGKGSWVLAGRRSFYDLLANNVYSKNYVFPFYYDLFAKLSYNFSQDRKMHLFYSHLGEGAKMYSIENENIDLLNSGTGNIFGLQYHSILSPSLAANMNLGYYSDQNDLKIYDTFTYRFGAKLNYDVNRLSLRGDLSYYPTKRLNVKTGAELLFNRTNVLWSIDWRNFVELPDSMQFHVDSFRSGAYWKAKFQFTSWFDVNFGIRYDYSTVYNEAEWNPRGKLRLSPRKDLTLWFATGKYSQFPDIMTIIGRGEPMDITKNSQELVAEQAYHNIFGTQWSYKSNIVTRLELYRKTFQRLLTTNDDNHYIPVNDGVGFAQGVEFTFRKIRDENDRLSFWLNYGYSEAKWKNAKYNNWYYLDYDQRHQADVGFDVKLSKTLIFGVTYHYGSGFPYTPIMGLKRNADSVGGYLDGWEVDKARKNSSRYPPYSRLDVRLSYEMKGAYHFSAYIDFINVLNNHNIYLYQWDFYPNANGKTVGKRSIIYMLPFIPSFGLSLSL